MTPFSPACRAFFISSKVAEVCPACTTIFFSLQNFIISCEPSSSGANVISFIFSSPIILRNSFKISISGLIQYSSFCIPLYSLPIKGPSRCIPVISAPVICSFSLSMTFLASFNVSVIFSNESAPVVPKKEVTPTLTRSFFILYMASSVPSFQNEPVPQPCT